MNLDGEQFNKEEERQVLATNTFAQNQQKGSSAEKTKPPTEQVQSKTAKFSHEEKENNDSKLTNKPEIVFNDVLGPLKNRELNCESLESVNIVEVPEKVVLDVEVK